MNFFCVGFLLLAFQLNVSFVSNYVVKLIGMLFLAGGIWEMSAYRKKYNDLLKSVFTVSFGLLIAIIVLLIFKVVSIPQTASQIIEVTIGSVFTILAILIQNKIIDLMVEDNELVVYVEEVHRLQKSWKMLVFFTLSGVVLNVFNIVPVNIVKDVSALLMVFSRIVMYVYALIVFIKFIKIRNDYYMKHK